MRRVFLSHSSKDKERYLRPLLDKLSKDAGTERFVYDEVTFEAGLENEELIIDWLSRSDLFVLFLSNDSLNSSWVKKEILEASDLQSLGQIKKIYPIIIDPSITHEDRRIPDWMRDTYNLRFVSKPAVAARKIISMMREISWKQTPKLKEKQQFFVGRNDLINTLESRLDNYDIPSPNTLVATGMEYIGRRTFLKKGLTKLDLIEDSYAFPSLKLDAHQSIEDFIKLLDDFGMTSLDLIDIDLLKMSKDEKTDLAVNLLLEINRSKDIVLIKDEGAIISPTREISSWFVQVNDRLSEKSSNIFLCVISRYRTNQGYLFKRNVIFSMHVPELSLQERKGLLKRYSSLIGLNLDNKDMNYVSSFFSGLPEEIIYTCDLIKENGIDYVKRNVQMITDYSDRKVSSIMAEYEKDITARSFLALVASFDFVSYELLQNIVGSNTEYNNLIEEFFAKGICDNLGSNGEYLVLNSAIKNYILRQRIPLTKEFQERIKRHVEEFVVTYDKNEDGRDVSDVFFSLKEALVNGNAKSTPESQMLIPSHYLKSMKELYDKRNRDQEVVKLADKILEQEEYMDDHIIREIRYFLCSSLARLKNERFKSEVQSISGAEHKFLFGFYYRQVGRDEEAARSLSEALNLRPIFSRAKRELVTVYQNMDEYDKAYELAKGNYEENRNNEYHIQAYFQILLHTKELELEEKDIIMSRLLEDIGKIDSEKAKNMYSIMEIEYTFYIKRDIESAKTLVDSAVMYSSDNLYMLLCQFDIYEKANDVNKLKQILGSLKNNIGSPNTKFYKEYQKCRAIYEVRAGNLENARNIARSSSIPKNTKKNLLSKIDKIYSESM